MTSNDWITEVILNYESRLIRYTNRLLRDLDKSRDVVQESFLKLCKENREDVEPKLPSWLFVVCRNGALNKLRKEKPMAHAVSVDELASDNESASEKIEREQKESSVLKALNKLNEKQQEVMVLKFQEGLSYKEISEITGHSVSHVGVIIHESVAKIKEIMTPKINLASKGGVQ